MHYLIVQDVFTEVSIAFGIRWQDIFCSAKNYLDDVHKARCAAAYILEICVRHEAACDVFKMKSHVFRTITHEARVMMKEDEGFKNMVWTIIEQVKLKDNTVGEKAA